MRISTLVKRSYLRTAYAAATAGSIALRTYLETLSKNASTPALTGQLAASVSGNGASISFSAPGSSAPGPTDAAAAYEELIELYDQIDADTASITTDAAFHTEMQARLRPAYSSFNSFATLRRS